MSSYLSERVSYLKGLSDGLAVKDETAEGKLLLKIIDVLQDVSDAVDELQDDMDEMNEYVETIDEDLSELEDDLYEDDEDEEEGDFLEMECPHCHEVVYFDEQMLGQEDMICPECHQPIFDEADQAPEA